MGGRESAAGGRVFTIELNSRNNLKDVAAPSGSGRVTIEGTIGVLRRAEFVDDSVLELTGSGGVLRVDLSREDFAKRAQKKEEVGGQSAHGSPISNSCSLLLSLPTR